MDLEKILRGKLQAPFKRRGSSKLLRIGDKVISLDRLTNLVGEILHRRSTGSTQQEVAAGLGVDRAFVSHLEKLGEVRRGKSVALVGFPVGNKAEIEEVAREAGVDFTFLLTQEERTGLASGQNGANIFNMVLSTIAQIRGYETVVFMGSDRRISEMEKILGREVIGVNLGHSPLKDSKVVDLAELRNLLASLTEGAGRREKGRWSKSRIFKKRPRGRTRTAGAKA